MMLRRLTAHLRQQDWFAVVLELIVVIVGIFLAFQVDRWYEAQRIKSDLRTHVASLMEDFSENEARLSSALSVGKQEMEAAITLRAEIRKESPDLSVAELNQLFSETSSLPTFQAVDLAYRNLITAGTLAELPSSDLKKELAEFYAAHELTKLIQNTQELQFVTIWHPYALENLDYAASNTKHGITRDDKALRPYIDPDLILEAMKTKEFENIIVIQWETAEDLVNNWSRLLDRVKRIQAKLATLN
ncbi:MAG: hypothetical protein OEQ14_17745 [Gammaproteobacteria bacterium]|nr:hypothetical protein [Gammaproteobacteria bacterium]